MNQPIIPANLNIHGIRLVNLTMDDSLCAIEAAINSRQPTRVAFVNADCVNIASVNSNYQQHLSNMDWVFVDGIGMRVAGRILKQPVRDNVNGTDLFPLLCASLAAHGRRLYLLGAKPGVAAAVAQWAQSNFPGLKIAGTQHGYFKPEDNERIVNDIRSAQADIVLVALGAPRQEAWINQNISASGASVLMGVGGLFDYYSGLIPRAPMWIRRLGMEWIFRLLQEPARLWRRYLIGNGVFLFRISIDWLRGIFNKKFNPRSSS